MDFTHQEALDALNRAQVALNHARNTVDYLETEVAHLTALCENFMYQQLQAPHNPNWSERNVGKS